MSYYDPYQNNFNTNPYMNQRMMQQHQPMQATQQVLRINGKNGVDALRLAPNSSVLALDTEQPIVWLITTDGAGYKTPTPYKIEPYVEQTAPDASVQFNSQIASLERRIEQLEGVIINGQSDSSNTSKKQSSARKSATNKNDDVGA